MLVKDFVAMDKHGSIFCVVDATRTGYMTYPDSCILDIAGRSVVTKEFGEYEIVGFAPRSKNSIMIYVK